MQNEFLLSARALKKNLASGETLVSQTWKAPLLWDLHSGIGEIERRKVLWEMIELRKGENANY